MVQLLGLLLLSFFITSILIVPFIDYLYKIKLRRKKQVTRDPFNKKTPIFDKHHAWKAGTPVGGGIMVILVVAVLSLWSFGLLGITPNIRELIVILFAFISFGLLGFYDDVKKTFGFKGGFFGLRMRYKFALQWVLGFAIGAFFYFVLGYNFIYIPFLGPILLGPIFIFLVALIIVSFANAFNITDGLDGLAGGLLMIALTAFWIVAGQILDQTLAIFIALWVGSLIAFLYFNVYPARIWMGDVGSLAFGAALAVVGLLTGKMFALAVIGGVFVTEVFSSASQLLSKKFFGKKLFYVAPLHLWFQEKGWEEPKVVMRFWLAGILLAIFGLWVAFL